MTHDPDFEQLCVALAANAKRYAAREITLTEWCEQVERMLRQHYGDALDQQRAPIGALA